jgi:hypothetical protein
VILALLLAQASAVEAERAFAADAQRLGQWTAFRKWATDDAVMFWPQPVKAQDKLKTLPDPPKSVEWRPARSFVSCDGTMAANTGPWRNANGGIGYFSTIWVRQPDSGWKWTVDHGDAVETHRFAWEGEPMSRQAACGSSPTIIPYSAFVLPPKWQQVGTSQDGTLAFHYFNQFGKARSLQVWLWSGASWQMVIDDNVLTPSRLAPPPPPKP